MTDRVRSLVVTLDRDMRTDDVEEVIRTIRMLRYVSDVENGPVVDIAQHTARSVALSAVKKRVWDALMSREADKSIMLDGSDK